MNISQLKYDKLSKDLDILMHDKSLNNNENYKEDFQ